MDIRGRSGCLGIFFDHSRLIKEALGANLVPDYNRPSPTACKMKVDIIDNTEASQSVLKVLTQHLPNSLPLLRRLQSMQLSAGRTLDSHVLSTFGREDPGRDFLVAYVDLSKCPETEIWLYSSMENTEAPGNAIACEEQVLTLFARVREIEKTFEGLRQTPGIVLVATLHSRIFEILEKHSLVRSKTEEHLKFIFKMDTLPAGKPLPDELFWSTIKLSEIPLVLSRTTIPYQAYVEPVSGR